MRILIFFLVFFQPYCIFSLYSTKDEVITTLTKENFAKTVFGSPNVWLIEFYGTWCGHCQKLAPEYKQVATKLKGLVKVAAIDVDKEKELASAFKIEGLPTIKLFPSDLSPSPSGKAKEVIKKPVDYQGPRTAAAIARWAISQLPNYVVSVDSKNIEKITEGSVPVVLLFTEKTEVSPLYKALAIDFKWRVRFGQVQQTQTDLVSRFGITKFPTILLLKEGENTIYDGAFKHEAIFQWLTPLVPAAPQPEQNDQTKQEQTKKEKHLSETKPEVIALTSQEVLDTRCPRGLCMIFFLDPTYPEEHTKYMNLLDSLSKKYITSFRVFWVDVTKKPNFASQFDLAAGYPQLVAIAPHKKVFMPFFGYFSQESIAEWVDLVLKGKGRPSVYNNIVVEEDQEPFVDEDNQEPFIEEEKDGLKDKEEL